MIIVPSSACRLAATALACVCLLLSAGCKIRTSGAVADARDGDVLQYTVVEGDTLSRIAARYRIEVQDIVDANGLKHVDLYVGQRLALPGAHRPYVYQAKARPDETPAAPAGDTGWYRPRSSWAVQPIEQGNIFAMGPITRITVHHSADDIDAGGDVVDTLRRIEKQHKLGMGKNEPFACIGYHFVIDAEGRVWEGRPLQYQGAHSTGDNNKGNVGICLLGNFDRGRPTPAQRATLTQVLDRLCAQYRVPRNQVFGHNHFKTTDCPGKYLDPIVKAYHDGR